MAKKKESRRADGRVEIARTINGKLRHFYGKTRREAEEKYKAALAESTVIKDGDSLEVVSFVGGG